MFLVATGLQRKKPQDHIQRTPVEQLRICTSTYPTKSDTITGSDFMGSLACFLAQAHKIERFWNKNHETKTFKFP